MFGLHLMVTFLASSDVARNKETDSDYEGHRELERMSSPLQTVSAHRYGGASRYEGTDPHSPSARRDICS